MKFRVEILAVGAAIVVTSVVAAACGGGSSIGPQPSPSPTAACIQAVERAPVPMAAFGVMRRLPQNIGRDIVPDKIVVRFAAATHSRSTDDAITRANAKLASSANPQGWVVYDLIAAQDPSETAGRIRTLPGVAEADVVHYRYLEATPIPTITPNDPDLGNTSEIKPGGEIIGVDPPVQWDMFISQMPQAWATTNGMGLTSVKIAIIDTGYDTMNTDLQGKVDAAAVFDNGHGQQATCAGVTVQDNDDHGTNVSGIAAADTNNASRVAGVGWNTHLLEARVFPYPVGTSTPQAQTTDIAAAINWAVANGAKVINLSLGGLCPDDPVEQSAIEAAIGPPNNVTVVAASGNHLPNGLNQIDCPAADPGVIAVGASGLNDPTPGPVVETIAPFSDYGNNPAEPGTNSLDLVAPGGNAASSSDDDYLHWILNLASITGSPSGNLVLIVGTSQAAPHVSGVAALMYAKNGALTPAMIKAIFDNPANDANICSGCPQQGHGRLDAFKALAAVP